MIKVIVQNHFDMSFRSPTLRLPFLRTEFLLPLYLLFIITSLISGNYYHYEWLHFNEAVAWPVSHSLGSYDATPIAEHYRYLSWACWGVGGGHLLCLYGLHRKGYLV